MNYYNLSLLLYYKRKGVDYAKKSLQSLETLLQKYPDYTEKPRICAYIAEIYRRLGKFDEAIDSCEKGLETANKDEDRIMILVGLGCVYRDGGNHEESERAFNQALELAKGKKDLSKINFQYGILHLKTNNIQEAVEAFKNALKFIEFDVTLRNNKEYRVEILWHLGSAHYYNEEYEIAISHLKEVSDSIEESNVYYCNTHITLGHCYLAKRDYTQAGDHYNKALSASLATREEIAMANECLKRIEKEHDA